MEAVISFPSHQQCHHHQQQYHQQQQHHLQQLIATASAAATDNTSAVIPPVSSSQTPVPTSKPIAEATSIEYTNETGQNNEQKQLTSDDDQNQRLTLPSENPVHSQSPSHLSLENHLPKEFLELYGDAIINSSNEHQPQQYFYSSPLIYSEPALSSSSNTTYSYAPALAGCYAFSEMAIPQIYADTTYRDNSQTGAISSNEEENDELNLREKIGAKAERNDSVAGLSRAATMNAIGRSSFGRMLSKGFTPRSSCLFQTDSQPSVATTAVGSSYIPNKQQSFSVAEIRDQHIQIQKKYRPSRKRHFTDPVDFEGILNIIGGCSWWQIWVYLLISLQQIPHAMFNLSVVYMMYQPDHWCQIPGLNQTNKDFKWTVEQTLNSSILYPRTRNRQREDPNFHSQCHYFDRGLKRFSQLGRMSLDEAEEAVAKEELPRIEKCTQWHYADDVMKKTIVTEWNLVCDDNFKRAHAHLFYSFGFLLGCLLGGYSSDRFGRKPTVIGFGILSSMFGLILPYATYFPMFLFIRFCGAVCNEAADLAAYVLCMEITGTRYRAMVGSLLQAPWAVGYATLALIAYFCKSWQSIQLITAGLHTISICLICVLPESPRWLIVNNRVDEAERYIRRACREPPFPFKLFSFNKSSLPCDLELVKHAEQRQWVRRDQRANIFHLLKSRALCMRTAIVCIVWIATALVYYGLIIALSDQSAPGRVLFSGNFFVNNAIAGAIELPTLLSCVYLMKYGRKRSQMFTLMAAAVFIFAAMGAISIRSQMVSLCLMLIGKIFIQGAFNILYIFTSELYPTVIRNSAVGFCSMIARFGSGVSSYIAILSDVTLAIVPMIIFSIFSLFAGVLVLLLPETRDQPLPDTLQDAVTFLKNKHEYECVGNLMNGFNQKFFGGKLSVSVMGLGNRDGGESTNCSNCGDTCTCGATEPDDQRTLVDVDADDVASTVSSVVTSNTAAAPPQSSSLPQRKRSETLNPAIMTVEQSVLPSIPEVPDYEHLQLQQRNSQQQQQHGSEMSNESEKKDPELLVDIGAEDNISGLVLNLDDHIAAESEDRLTALSLATPIGSADLASTPVRQRHSAGETGGPVKKVSVGTNDSFLLAALADDPVMPPPNKMSALKNRKSAVLPRPRSSNSATIDSAPFPTRTAAKVRFPVTLSPPPRPIISSREHSPSSREQEQSAALNRRPFLLGHRRCNSRE